VAVFYLFLFPLLWKGEIEYGAINCHRNETTAKKIACPFAGKRDTHN